MDPQGDVTVGERESIFIPAELRKALKIQSSCQVMTFTKPDKKIISHMSTRDFMEFLNKTEEMIRKMGSGTFNKF